MFQLIRGIRVRTQAIYCSFLPHTFLNVYSLGVQSFKSCMNYTNVTTLVKTVQNNKVAAIHHATSTNCKKMGGVWYHTRNSAKTDSQSHPSALIRQTLQIR